MTVRSWCLTDRIVVARITRPVCLKKRARPPVEGPLRVTAMRRFGERRPDSGGSRRPCAGSIVARLFTAMSLKSLLIVTSLLAIVPASTLYAQDEGNDGGRQAPAARTDGGREAVGTAIGRAVERPASRPAPAPAAPAAPPRPY